MPKEHDTDQDVSSTRRLLLASMATLPALAGAVGAAAAPSERQSSPIRGGRKPNVIVILADDLGHNDLSVNGNPYVATPNIDALAHSGVRFGASYSCDAVCSPSRAGLLTGRDPQRFGFEFLTYGMGGFEGGAGGRSSGRAAGAAELGTHIMTIPGNLPASPQQAGLDPNELLLPQMLKTGGYRTGMVGKWHLGSDPTMHPNHRGFDDFVGFLGGASLYAKRGDPTVVVGRQPWAGRDEFLWSVLGNNVRRNDGPPEAASEYMTDFLSSEAVKFIDKNADQPFFLYVAYNAPHAPLQAPKRIYDQLGAIKDENTRIYYAMVQSLDEGVGRILEELRRKGLEEDTIVFFASDNGAAPLSRTRNRLSNIPFRGSKLTYFEGGINVPVFVRWPRRVKAGTVVRGPASQLDIFPTVLAAAGVPLPADRPYDGVNLLPTLEAADSAGLDDRPPLVWRKEHYYGVRQGAYMLQVSQYPPMTWLFDLERDPTEKINLAAKKPEIVAQLQATFEQRAAAYKKPWWGPTSRSRVDIDAADDVAGEDQEYVMWSN